MPAALTPERRHPQQSHRALTGATAVKSIIVFQVAVSSEWTIVGMICGCRRRDSLEGQHRVVIGGTPGHIFGVMPSCDLKLIVRANLERVRRLVPTIADGL